MTRTDHRSFIPAAATTIWSPLVIADELNLPLPLVERLGIKPKAWLATMAEAGSMLGSAIGGPEARQRWAASRRQKWAADKSGPWE
jgi:hypothetical protein